jgi:hypothetical protein
MKNSAIYTEYQKILQDCSQNEKILILLLTLLMLICHTRVFVFICMGLFIYPVAVYFYLTGATPILFAEAFLIQCLASMAVCKNWPERKTEKSNQQEAFFIIFDNIKNKQL